jgi:Tol biopolymer transport system component
MAVAAAMVLSVVVARAQSPDGRTLQRAIDLIESKGDVRAARPLLEEAAKSAERAVAARALLYLAQVTAVSDPATSRRSLERIVADYADQQAIADAARARLAELGASPGMPRLLCEHCADFYGAVSPDGRLMAAVSPFFGGENAGDIGILDLAGSTLTPLHIEGSGRTPTGLALSPFFSPDSLQIAYAWGIEATKSFELRIVARDGRGTPRVVVSNPEITYIEPQGWSRSGSLLVMLQRPDQTWEIGLVAPASGAITKVRSLDWRIAGSQHESSLSPDGRFIAYAALSTNPAAPIQARRGGGLERQIYVVAADGSGEVALTTGAGVKRHPVWTPNGSHVLYLSDVGGSWGLWAIPMQSGRPAGQPVLVKNDLGGAAPLGMTSSGGYHFYQGRTGVVRTAVVRLDSPRSGAARAEETFVGARPSWSPDGNAIAVARAGSSGGVEIVTRTLGTGDERVIKQAGIDAFPFNWTPDSRSLVFQAVDQKQPTLYRADLETGAVVKIAPVAADGFRAHGNIRALSPDGRTLYLGTSVAEGPQLFNRISALDLQTGARRDIFPLPLDDERLPRVAQDFAIAVSPDGRALALFFRDRKTDLVRLATVGIDGRDYRELTEPVAARNIRTKLAWSRDGRWIYFTTAAPAEGLTNADTDVHTIMRIAATGGRPESTGITVDGLERFDISPDGTRLAYSTLRPEGAGELLWNLDVSWLMKPGR